MAFIIGVDEVGRGSWAGPLLVVAARAKSKLPDGLADSKALSKSKRDSLIPELLSVCDFGEGWVQPEEIDTHGLAQAMRIGVNRALVALGADPEAEVIIDGNINYCPPEFSQARCEIKADNLYAIVSAASIYAKVTRDAHMTRIARFYPLYHFDKHVGYGTKLHRDSLQLHGVCALHRKSYKPVKVFMEASV